MIEMLALSAGHLMFTGIFLSAGFGIMAAMKGWLARIWKIAERKLAEAMYSLFRAVVRMKYKLNPQEFTQFAQDVAM